MFYRALVWSLQYYLDTPGGGSCILFFRNPVDTGSRAPESQVLYFEEDGTDGPVVL